MEEAAQQQDGAVPMAEAGAGAGANITSTSTGTGTSISDGSNPAKKHAKGGQWRTPPVPFFPSGSSPANAPGGVASGAPNGLEHEIPIPETPDDYALALQEAYRQGAEAAVSGATGGGMGIGMGMGMGSAVSCPDLGSLQPLHVLPASGSHGTLASVGEEVEEEPDPQLMAARQSAAAAAASAYPSELGAEPAAAGGSHRNQHHVQGGGASSALPVGPIRHPGAPAPSAPPQYGGAAAPMHPGRSGYAHGGASPRQKPAGRPPSSAGGAGGGASRSVSLPDISSYAAQADAEEAKRRKRLARNRASARLRRLRKKNLVCDE